MVEDLGKGQEWGVASGKTGSYYSLGQSSPGEPTQLLIHTGAAPDQGASGKPRCATNTDWMALLLLMPLRKDRITTSPQPPWATGQKPATLPCTVRGLKLKFLFPTADESVKRLNPLLSDLRLK